MNSCELSRTITQLEYSFTNLHEELNILKNMSSAMNSTDVEQLLNSLEIKYRECKKSQDECVRRVIEYLKESK